MGLSEFDVKNVHEIMAGHGTWFTAQLLRLIYKADPSNRQRISRGFPREVALVAWWETHAADDAPPLELVEAWEP